MHTFIVDQTNENVYKNEEREISYLLNPPPRKIVIFQNPILFRFISDLPYKIITSTLLCLHSIQYVFVITSV